MGLVGRFLHRPHSVWLRRALFQVHLWLGVTVSLYLAVIGASGSILVFVNELERMWYTGLTRAPLVVDQRTADLASVIDRVRTARPNDIIETVYTPRGPDENFLAVVQDGGRSRNVYADAITGKVVGQTDLDRSWINWLGDLHINLLMGTAGKTLNGIGALSLLLMAATGIVIWWRGFRTWQRALTVDFRKRWRRLVFELHGAVGFWAWVFLIGWAVSSLYLIWPREFVRVIGQVSRVDSAAPEVSVPLRGDRREPNLRAILASAHAVMPAARLAGIELPSDPSRPVVVLMARGQLGDFPRTSYLYFDPATGELLATWKRGINHSTGDWMVSTMSPMHFGMYWGEAVKVVWATVGLALPVLAMTGLLMYWNRVLSRKWRELMAPRE